MDIIDTAQTISGDGPSDHPLEKLVQQRVAPTLSRLGLDELTSTVAHVPLSQGALRCFKAMTGDEYSALEPWEDLVLKRAYLSNLADQVFSEQMARAALSVNPSSRTSFERSVELNFNPPVKYGLCRSYDPDFWQLPNSVLSPLIRLCAIAKQMEEQDRIYSRWHYSIPEIAIRAINESFATCPELALELKLMTEASEAVCFSDIVDIHDLRYAPAKALGRCANKLNGRPILSQPDHAILYERQFLISLSLSYFDSVKDALQDQLSYRVDVNRIIAESLTPTESNDQTKVLSYFVPSRWNMASRLRPFCRHAKAPFLILGLVAAFMNTQEEAIDN